MSMHMLQHICVVLWLYTQSVYSYSYGSGTCIALDSRIIYNPYTNPNGMQHTTAYTGAALNNGWQWINTMLTDFIMEQPLQYIAGQQQTFALVNTFATVNNWTGILVYAQETATGIRVGNFATTADMHTIQQCDGYINNTYSYNTPINPYNYTNTTLTHSHANPLTPYPSGYNQFYWQAPENYSEPITFYIAIMDANRLLVTMELTATPYNTQATDNPSTDSGTNTSNNNVTTTAVAVILQPQNVSTNNSTQCDFVSVNQQYYTIDCSANASSTAPSVVPTVTASTTASNTSTNVTTNHVVHVTSGSITLYSTNIIPVVAMLTAIGTIGLSF